jgi:O-antigen/teichoic acid export membrane protein
MYLILGERFITLWMGKEYAHSGILVLMILSIGHLLSLVHYPIHYLLLGISRHYIIAYLRVAEAVVNIVLSIILVNYWGIIGVALGTVIPHLVLMVIVLPAMACNLLEIKFFFFLRKSILRPLASAVIFGLVCFAAQHYFPARSLVLFFTEVLCLLVIYLFIVWSIALEQKERDQVLQTVGPLSSWTNRSTSAVKRIVQKVTK